MYSPPRRYKKFYCVTLLPSQSPFIRVPRISIPCDSLTWQRACQWWLFVSAPLWEDRSWPKTDYSGGFHGARYLPSWRGYPLQINAFAERGLVHLNAWERPSGEAVKSKRTSVLPNGTNLEPVDGVRGCANLLAQRWRRIAILWWVGNFKGSEERNPIPLAQWTTQWPSRGEKDTL